MAPNCASTIAHHLLSSENQYQLSEGEATHCILYISILEQFSSLQLVKGDGGIKQVHIAAHWPGIKEETIFAERRKAREGSIYV